MAKRKNSSKGETKPSHPKPLSAAALGKPFWSGTISFGLVNIPIRLYSGVHEKTVRFHMLHDKDNVRVQQKLVCPADGKEITRQEIVKGYEIAPDQNVAIPSDELQALAPKSQKTLELMSFVDLAQIDPIYFDRPFYVVPGEGGAKAYHLLLEALGKAKKAGIGKFVMKSKEYLAAIRPVDSILCLETMHFKDEVVMADELIGAVPAVKASEAEVKMAIQLVESLSDDFKPELMHDDYRDALMDLISKKSRGVKPSTAAAPDEEPQVIDLMAALQRSLQTSKKTKARKAA